MITQYDDHGVARLLNLLAYYARSRLLHTHRTHASIHSSVGTGSGLRRGAIAEEQTLTTLFGE